MSEFDEAVIQRIKQLEREVERLQRSIHSQVHAAKRQANQNHID